MSEGNKYDRRRFLETAVMTVTAAELGAIGSAFAQSGSNNQYNAEKISKIELPTGGRIEDEWTDSSLGSEVAIYRRMTERRVYSDGATC